MTYHARTGSAAKGQGSALQGTGAVAVAVAVAVEDRGSASVGYEDRPVRVVGAPGRGPHRRLEKRAYAKLLFG